MERDPDAIRDICREEFVQRNPLGDYTLPIVALLRGRRGHEMLRRTFGDETLIETLPLEYLCVSCDLLGAELVVHGRGRIVDAVGASLCIPGVIPPVATEERLLVDGGVLNNLPTQQLAATGDGPVIAVDVSKRRPPTVGLSRPVDTPLGRFAAAVRRLVTGFPEPRPRILDTMLRTVLLGSETSATAREYASLTIAPDTSEVGVTAFDQLDRLREEGRRAAHSALAQAPAELFG